jgi:hypothetical protein
VKRISSRQTVFIKYVFPVIWFGFIAVFCTAAVMAPPRSSLPPLFLFVPAFLAVLGFVLLKKLVWDLADEVYDRGDYLLVRKAGEEENVVLSNVMNVSASLLLNPPRITLKLVQPGKFGSEIAFTPIRAFTFNPFAKDQVSEDLMERVDQARSKRRA